MAKTKRPWTVGKHSPLIQIDENLWAVEDMLGPIHRRMCVMRRADGALLFFHAVPVDDATISEIKKLGTPKYLVVGHHQHAVDAHAFQQKFELQAYGPAAIRSEHEKRFALAGALVDMPADPSIECVETPGSKHHEVTVFVKSGTDKHVSILVSDALQNNDPAKLNFFFRMLGFAGGPKVVPLYRMFFASDTSVLKKTLENWASIPNLKRLVPFHGAIVENPAGAIKAAAATL